RRGFYSQELFAGDQLLQHQLLGALIRAVRVEHFAVGRGVQREMARGGLGKPRADDVHMGTADRAPGNSDRAPDEMNLRNQASREREAMPLEMGPQLPRDRISLFRLALQIRNLELIF